MSPHQHKSILLDLGGKIGPPVFSGALVACLLSGTFRWMHFALLATGLALIVVEHLQTFHHSKR